MAELHGLANGKQSATQIKTWLKSNTHHVKTQSTVLSTLNSTTTLQSLAKTQIINAQNHKGSNQ